MAVWITREGLLGSRGMCRTNVGFAVCPGREADLTGESAGAASALAGCCAGS